MANKNVNILLKLQDQFTKPLREAGTITKEQQKAMRKCSESVIGFSRNVRNGFLSGVGHVAKFGAALAGISGVLSVGDMKSFAADSMELAKAQVEAETKLEAVLGDVKSIAAGGTEAIQAAKGQLMGVASDIQKVGVIGDEVTLAGMQQLATFQLSADQISTLSKGMTDLLAQQKGLNATQGDAVGIANLIGKAMMGNVGALTRVGITLDENQQKLIKNGDATQRAAVLAEVLEQNVGGVNAALADTDQGRIQQMANSWGDAKEEIGKALLKVKASLAANLVDYIPKVQEIGVKAVEKLSQIVDKGVKWAKDHSEQIKAAVAGIRDMAVQAWARTKPVLTFAVTHARTLIPAILGVVGAISGISVVADVVKKVHSAYVAFKDFKTAIAGVKAAMTAAKVAAFGPAVLILGAVVAAGILVYKNWDKIKAAAQKLKEKLGPVFQTVRDKVLAFRDGVVALKDGFISAFNKIKEKVAPIIGWIQEKIEGIKKVIDGLKQAWRDVTSGPWVDNSGGGAGADLHGHALGTPYFAGGLTRINEGGRGEIVDLPSGTRIIPHDVAKSAVGGGPTINVSVNVQGNVIGNRSFMEQTGRYIAERVLTALATT